MNVFGILAIILDEATCASLFRNKRWNGNISCPHCKSNDIKNMENMRFIFSDISVTAATTHSTTRPGLYFITLTCPHPGGSFLSGCPALSHQYLEYKSGRLVKRWGGGVQYKTCYYMTRKVLQKIVTVYSCEVLRTRYVKTGYFFDTNTKELQNSRQLQEY